MDYFVDNSKIFKTELARIEEKIDSLKKERKFAISHNIGLGGPILATTKEIFLLQSEASDLKKKISIVDKGFAFFEVYGFERALDACGMVYGVETLSQDLNGDVIGFKDTQVRVPIDVQKEYLSAVKLKLFDLFIIYWAFEPEEDETMTPRKVDYYLFGSAGQIGSAGPETYIDFFLIGQWTTRLEI